MQYKEYSNMFFKTALDKLPPHQSNNYQIKIKEGACLEQTVGYSPLYKQSWEELEVAHEYIINNLSKRFIRPSNAPYTSLILMV